MFVADCEDALEGKKIWRYALAKDDLLQMNIPVPPIPSPTTRYLWY